MGKELSKENDDQRRKPAKKKSAEQTKAEPVEESSELPSRVHIFAGKSKPGGSSKSGGQELQFSAFRTDRAIASLYRPVQAAIFPVALSGPPPIISLSDELGRLRLQIQRGKKALFKASMKAEDLEALIQGLRQTLDRISKRRW